MPASFAAAAHAFPTSGEGLESSASSQACITHMDQIDITGGMSLSSLLTAFGKVVDKGRRKITLTFDIYSEVKLVNAGVQPNKADKDTAFAGLTEAEKLVVVKYEVAIKAAAAARAEQDILKLAERWTVTGTATKA